MVLPEPELPLPVEPVLPPVLPVPVLSVPVLPEPIEPEPMVPLPPEPELSVEVVLLFFFECEWLEPVVPWESVIEPEPEPDEPVLVSPLPDVLPLDCASASGATPRAPTMTIFFRMLNFIINLRQSLH